MEISPDLVEWIVADDKVASHWVSLARRLGLSSHVAKVEVKGRRYRTDKHKLAKIMRLWKEEAPTTYNVNTLKNLLAAEGLNDMLMWISMMTQSNSARREELADVVYRKLSCPTPRNLQSPGQRAHRSLSMRQEVNPTISPMGRHLYSPLPSSPYSIYFGTQSGFTRDNQRTQSYSRSSYGHGESPYSCFDSVSTSRQSTPDSTSRPTSRLSEYGYINPSPIPHPHVNPSPTHHSHGYPSPTPGYTNPSPILGTSCPATPLQRRSSLKPTWTPTSAHQTYRTRNRSSSPAKGVYDLLYRPDLIKLSSPYTRSTHREDKDNVFHGQDSLVIEEPNHKTHKLTNGLENKNNEKQEENGSSFLKTNSFLEQRKTESNEKFPVPENNLKKPHQNPVLEVKKEIGKGELNKTVSKKIKFENFESIDLSENSVQNLQMDLNIKESNEKNCLKNESKQNNSFANHERLITKEQKKESEIKEEVIKTIHRDYVKTSFRKGSKDDVEQIESNESTVEKAKQNIDAVIEGLQNIAIINEHNNKQTSNFKKTINYGQTNASNKSEEAIFNLKQDNSPKKPILRPKLDELATVPSPRKGGNNTMDAYFDNLIILLDEAAEGLNV